MIFTTAETGSLFDEVEPAGPTGEAANVHVRPGFLDLVSKVLCHSAPDRFALLYKLLWRIRSGERDLLDRLGDAEVARATAYAKAVERDVYRMQAFVRFAERNIGGKAVSLAWYEPQHRVLRRAAPFFVDRFTNMDWLIATPFGTAAWTDGKLSFGPPASRPARADDGVLDELWTTYFRATFNPARLRVKAMTAQMPKRHWPTMPETALIPELVQSASLRTQSMHRTLPDEAPRYAASLAKRMVQTPPAAEADSLEGLRRKAEACRLCPLHEPATQTVFGEGPVDARVMFVGEQPGDHEDLTGRPFVGPAGQVFDRALAQAGIDRTQVYVTNAVKHFKFEPRGKRRIHSKPSTWEVSTCRFWLERELASVRPKLVVALGATAVLAVTGRSLAVTKSRGEILQSGDLPVLVTVHPSYLLRIPDTNLAELEFGHFVKDLSVVRDFLLELPATVRVGTA